MNGRVALVLCLLVASCAAPAPGPSVAVPTGSAATASSPAAPSLSASEAAAAITSFDTEPERLGASFAEIHRQAEERPDEIRAAALNELDTATGDVRYAAVYALALSADGSDALAALEDLLRSPDVDERMLAAGSLIARGERAAIPVLIEMLASQEELAFRDPPQPAWRFARFVLLNYTVEDLGLIGPRTFSAGDAMAAQPAWEKWWADHVDSLQYDPQQRLYR